MRSKFRRIVAAVAVVLSASAPAKAAEITVFAAASLSNALSEVAAGWSAKANDPMRFSFAASSTLAKQLEAGAPAHLFISADDAWMNYLADRKLIAADSRVTPIGNSLALIAPASSAMSAVDLMPGVNVAALLGATGRLSTGDPAHVPVGRYAQAALTKLGAWDAIAGRIAPAESVRVAMALVERGEAPLGIVYATDAALSAKVKVVGSFPDGSHDPVVYPFAVATKQDGPAARAALAYLTGAEAKAVYAKYGFKVR